MADLWSDLPPEVLEEILSRLPIQAQCRVRRVCKRWNHLISDESFAALTTKQTSYILIVSRMLGMAVDNFENQCPWEVLDIAERRYYKLNEHFIMAHLKPNVAEFHHFIPFKRCTLAADKGLIYAMYFKLKTKWHLVCIPETQRHLIYNPVTHEVDEIPGPDNFRFHHHHERFFFMVTDPPSQTYRIFTIQKYNRLNIHAHGEVHVYESMKRRWRHLCNVPDNTRFLMTSSCVFMQGALFVLVFELSSIPWVPNVYMCDLDICSWVLVAAKLPWIMPHPHDKMQLVVSSERLFVVQLRSQIVTMSHRTRWEVFMEQWEVFVGRGANLKRAASVTIYEIFLAKKEVKMVAEMPTTFDPVVAVALGESIVVSSLVTGESVAFNLQRQCWHDPMQDAPEHPFGMCMSDPERGFAGVMQLDLRKMNL